MESMSDALSRQFDPAAAAKVRRLPVQSAMPGTTLKFIPLKAFQTGGCLIGETERIKLSFCSNPFSQRVSSLKTAKEERVPLRYDIRSSKFTGLLVLEY